MTHRERCRWLDAALAVVADAVFAADALGHIIYLNPAAETMTGWRLAESLGRSLGEVLFLVDSESDRVLDVAQRAIDAAESRVLLNAALVNRRGLQTDIEYAAAARRDEHGRSLGTVIVCRPRRHAAEIALQTTNESLNANADALFEEKERAQVTLNSIGDAVISTNFSGRVTYLNIVAEKMTGWAQADAAGRAVEAIFHLEDPTSRARIQSPAGRAIIDNRRVTLEAVCVLGGRGSLECMVEVSATPIHDRNGGVIGAVLVVHDVTAARQMSRKLARLALHDSLTDLPNRALFADRLGQAIAGARDHARHAALLYVDLDRFKHINDGLGHAVGDLLLQTVARRLQGCVRSSDTVSRRGGDEFVVLLPDLQRVRDAAACAEKILCALQSPYRIAEHELRVTASIGIAVFPDDAGDGEALVRCADFAMYQAKYSGRNGYRVFVPGMQGHPVA